MDAVPRTRRFRPGRFVVLFAIGAAINLAVFEHFSPERLFLASDAAAEVELKFDSERPPTADQVRRRALSEANLAAVHRRLTNLDHADIAEPEVAERNAQFDRWRRQIAVEVRSAGGAGRKRIRFVALNEQSAAAASILAETVAAQYAADVAAERRLSIAEPIRRADAADEESNRFNNELVELMQSRTRMLETMQPAHPDVVALDARLDKLRSAAAGSPVRRISAEQVARPSKICELLGSYAAEIPDVSTVESAVRPWNSRTFWHIAACLPALCVAWLASRGIRRAAEPSIRLSTPVRSNRTPARVVIVRRRIRSASNAT